MGTTFTKFSFLILTVLLTVRFESFSQLEQPDRIEIILESEDDYFQVLSAEESIRSAGVLAKLGAEKIAAGGFLSNDQLVPEYLRAP